MKAFAIGPTTNPCTKGIWMWSEPIELIKDTVLLILDTEGLNSVRKKGVYYIRKRHYNWCKDIFTINFVVQYVCVQPVSNEWFKGWVT